MSAPTSFFDTQFTTPFSQTKSVKEYLINQTAFSTALGFFVCRLPVLQSAMMGLATEGCRYATDKALNYLSRQSSFVGNYKTIAKTAALAGSFFISHSLINTILPGSSCLFKASLLMYSTYLFAEPIVRRLHESYSADIGIKAALTNIKNDIYGKYNTPDGHLLGNGENSKQT